MDLSSSAMSPSAAPVVPESVFEAVASEAGVRVSVGMFSFLDVSPVVVFSVSRWPSVAVAIDIACLFRCWCVMKKKVVNAERRSRDNNRLQETKPNNAFFVRVPDMSTKRDFEMTFRQLMRSLLSHITFEHFAFIPTTTAQTPGQGDIHRHRLGPYIQCCREQEEQTHTVVDKNTEQPLYLSHKIIYQPKLTPRRNTVKHVGQRVRKDIGKDEERALHGRGDQDRRKGQRAALILQ